MINDFTFLLRQFTHIHCSVTVAPSAACQECKRTVPSLSVCGFCFLRCIAALCWCNDLITVYCCFRLQAWNLHSPQPPEKADPVPNVSKSDWILLYKPFINSSFIFLHPTAHSKRGLQIIFHETTRWQQSPSKRTSICCKFTSDYMQIWQQEYNSCFTFQGRYKVPKIHQIHFFFFQVTEHNRDRIMYKSMNIFEEKLILAIN